LPEGNLLIDTAPELRLQLVREGIGLIHAVAYTHAHADHLFGLDDLRIFPRYLGHDLPIYCRERVEKAIRRSFPYAFDPATREFPAGGVPRLAFCRIGDGDCPEPFDVLGARAVPIRLEHGWADVLGFRIGDVAYCTDVKRIPPEGMELVCGLDTLILDCLRPQPHPTHLGVDEAIELASRVAARRTLLTHMSHQLEHEATNRELPNGIALAHDGMRIAVHV
jgi:phosphoribosyl 1,2-cyclic phosphate phosphodiesterase